MSSQELNTTSYAVLGLLSLRPWPAYELAAEMQHCFAPYWPRVQSRTYEQAERLVANGLAAKLEERRGRRYCVAGRDPWCQHEGHVRALVGDFLSDFFSMVRAWARRSLERVHGWPDLSPQLDPAEAWRDMTIEPSEDGRRPEGNERPGYIDKKIAQRIGEHVWSGLVRSVALARQHRHAWMLEQAGQLLEHSATAWLRLFADNQEHRHGNGPNALHVCAVVIDGPQLARNSVRRSHARGPGWIRAENL